MFIIETNTICEGWINCWSKEIDEGVSVPETFETREAAQAAIDEYRDDITDAIECGYMEPSDDKLRIREVPNSDRDFLND